MVFVCVQLRHESLATRPLTTRPGDGALFPQVNSGMLDIHGETRGGFGHNLVSVKS